MIEVVKNGLFSDCVGCLLFFLQNTNERPVHIIGFRISGRK